MTSGDLVTDKAATSPGSLAAPGWSSPQHPWALTSEVASFTSLSLDIAPRVIRIVVS